MEFGDLDLEGCDFYRASLINLRFSSGRMQEAILDSVDCRNSQLVDVVLKDAQIVGAHFPGSELTAVNFSGSLIRDTSFVDTRLTHCEFSGVDRQDLASCLGLDVDALPPERPERAEKPATAFDPTVAMDAIEELGPPVESRTVIMKGAPCGELTMKFSFLYLRAEELSRLILVFDQLYNRVLQAQRAPQDPSEVGPEERLRLTRVDVDAEATVTFRGVMRGFPGEGEHRTLGPLDIIREILRSDATGVAATSSKSIHVIREHKGGEGIEYDRTTIPVTKEEELGMAEKRLSEQREEFARLTRTFLPAAGEKEVREIADLAFQIPNEIFRRRNLWGLSVA
jgi:uncharacterized protein YjbI with pentapeptide repeats